MRPELPTVNGFPRLTGIVPITGGRTNPDDATERGRIPLAEILEEVERAEILFPRPFINYAEGIETVCEEVDELKAECRKNPTNRNKAKLRNEAIQAAAMLLRFLQDLCPATPNKEK